MSDSKVTSDGGERRVPRGLVAITPGTLERERGSGLGSLLESMGRAVAAAIEGGVRSIVLREPSLADGAYLDLALRIRAKLDQAADGPVWLSVHDRVHLARAAHADAVHLGGSSLHWDAAREVVGPAIAIGVSSHDQDGQDYGGADYHLHGPAFAPTSKPLYGRSVLGWEGVEEYAQGAERSVFAVGGITIERLRDRAEGRGGVREAGSSLAGVALIGGLWGTGPEPIVNGSSPLRDAAGIASRAAELRELSS